MKERPILFSGEMVRSILDGRKTQTRRVVKHKYHHLWQGGYYPTGQVLTNLESQPGAFMEFRHAAQDAPGYQGSPASFLVPCPYGKPGDRLWVREGFSGPYYQSKCPPSGWSDCDAIWYWADGSPDRGDWTKPKPSIHMPRWASRITLEIVSVRVERLQDISESDALAEGGDYRKLPSNGLDPAKARTWYRGMWETINGPGSWSANPWVWVIEFKLAEDV